MSRKSRFFGEIMGRAQNPGRFCGNDRSGLKFNGGGWHGFVHVEVYAGRNDDGEDADMVRVYITDHPFETQEHLTILYQGELNAAKAYAQQKRTMRRRASREANIMVREKLHRSNTPVHVLSEEDPFYFDESEES